MTNSSLTKHDSKDKTMKKDWNWWKELGKIAKAQKPTNKLDKEWEKEFDVFSGSLGAVHYQVKDFIRDVLSFQREELIQKIKGMKTDWFNYDPFYHEQLIDYILSLIKEGESK